MKKFWKKIVDWFKSLSVKSDDFTKKYAPIAINVVNWIKEFNESENADIIQTVVNGLTAKYGAGKAVSAVVSVVRVWMKKELPNVLDGLELANDVANAKTIQEKAVAAKNAIQKLTNLPDKALAWQKVAASLANYLADDGRISLNEAIKLIKEAYDSYANNSNKLEIEIGK